MPPVSVEVEALCPAEEDAVERDAVERNRVALSRIRHDAERVEVRPRVRDRVVGPRLEHPSEDLLAREDVPVDHGIVDERRSVERPRRGGRRGLEPRPADDTVFPGVGPPAAPVQSAVEHGDLLHRIVGETGLPPRGRARARGHVRPRVRRGVVRPEIVQEQARGGHSPEHHDDVVRLVEHHRRAAAGDRSDNRRHVNPVLLRVRLQPDERGRARAGDLGREERSSREVRVGGPRVGRRGRGPRPEKEQSRRREQHDCEYYREASHSPSPPASEAPPPTESAPRTDYTLNKFLVRFSYRILWSSFHIESAGARGRDGRGLTSGGPRRRGALARARDADLTVAPVSRASEST